MFVVDHSTSTEDNRFCSRAPVSHCGAYFPQRGLFSQICSTCCVLGKPRFSILSDNLRVFCHGPSLRRCLPGLCIVALRFKQVRDQGVHRNANVAGLVLGLISSMGISIVGSFQVTTFYIIHFLGAFLAFFMGLAYFWIQLFLTVPSPDRWWVEPARATCCLLCTGLIFAMGVLENTGCRSAAAACEWAFVMLLFCLFGLFAAEFRHIDGGDLTEQNPAVVNDPGAAETPDYVSHELS
ncbi:modulator of macroautophagy TMEM150B isoform 1-T3 [Spinachia spinachia]